MWVFPLGAALVSAAFAAVLARQWRERHRPSLLAWGIALVMFGVASFAAAAGMAGEWTTAWFRVYYLFGAIVNVPVLALGTIYLLGPRRAANPVAVALAVAVVVAAGAVVTADLDTRALATGGIPAGSEVAPAALRNLSRYYSYGGFLIVVGGAVWSAVRLGRGKSSHLRRLMMANVLIAIGTTVVAVGSGFARFGTGAAQGTIFAVSLLAGVSVMFLGFLKTRAPAGRVATASPQAASEAR